MSKQIFNDSCEMMLKNSKSLTEFAKEHRTLFEKICDIVDKFIEKINNAINSLYGDSTSLHDEARFMELYADDLQKVFDKALSDALDASESTVDHSLQSNENKKAAEDGGKVQKSFHGYSADGKGMYEGNFALGTPKKAKGERILKYIQDVWSKQPITLRIDNNGVIRYIEAHFDPTYDGNTPTDASKLMGGNRHGSSAEQRVTLDLADDYYQIAAESKYNYSKNEEGKTTEPHKEVFEWHYFVNDILFAEYGSNEYIPYRVTINVKERKDGTFVYSFSAEKEGSTTPRTLHAVVSAGNETDTNSESSDISIHNPNTKSKGKVQKSAAEVPVYASMPEFYAPLEGEYGYQGEGYTAANGLKLFTKYSVDTARDFIMSELILSEGKVGLARDLNEFYTFMATAKELTWDDIEKRAGEIADKHLSKRSEKVWRDPRAQEALDTIRKARISFDEKQRADAKAYSGSFGKYRQGLMGRVNITSAHFLAILTEKNIKLM